MMLTQFDPWREFRELRKNMEMMNRLFRTAGEEKGGEVDFIPAVNTREGEDAYFIETDLPGIKKEDISIDVHDNVLSISGERKVEKSREEDDFYRVESVYGHFERSFSLPDDVDPEQIEAKAEDGVLTVRIPKVQTVEKAPKKIEIK